jgi:GAF domain-containing protein
MKGFLELLAHLGVQLDAEAITLQGAALSMAEYIQGRMSCSRVSVWLFEGETGARVMRRIAGFDSGTPLTEPAVLHETEFTEYFQALTSKGLYACPDTLADPKLAAFRESYLVPNDIRASLDATIGANGVTWAVFCCAQRGAPREWTPQERRLLKRFADAISVKRARRRRREAEVASLMQRLLMSEPILLSEPGQPSD